MRYEGFQWQCIRTLMLVQFRCLTVERANHNWSAGMTTTVTRFACTMLSMPSGLPQQELALLETSAIDARPRRPKDRMLTHGSRIDRMKKSDEKKAILGIPRSGIVDRSRRDSK